MNIKKDKAGKDSLNNPHLVSHLIFEHIDEGVFMINQAGLITAYNPGLSRITAIPVEEAINQHWSDILQFKNQHGVEIANNPIEQVFQQQKNIRQSNSFIMSADQQNIPIHLVVYPWFNKHKKLESIVGVMREMSLEKQEEEAKTDFVSTASHEMRTPLAALEGYLSLLLEQTLNPEAQQYATKAYNKVQNLNKLFKDLLLTTQSEDGLLSYNPSSFSLNQLIETVLDDWQQKAVNKNITLNFNPQAVYQITADSNRITELFNNLIDNAFKFMTKDGQIDIRLKQSKGLIQIQVQDNGIGINQRDLPHIFQKFYKVNSNQPGSGLGLFISKQIVKLHKGDIWIESTVGQGTTFHISLPQSNLD